MDFASILAKSLLMYRNNVAVTFEGQHQDYATLGDRAARLANALADRGLEPGDRVAVLADNQLETLEQAVAIGIGGFVRAAMYAQNPPESNAYLLNAVGAKALIVQGRYAAGIAAIRDQIPSLEHVIVTEPVEGDAREGELDYEQLIAGASAEIPQVEIAPDADHIIRFSAGTTGKPKGIVHSAEGWLAMGNEFALALPRLVETDAYLVASPLSHAAGLMIWPSIAHGSRYVVMGAFDPVRFLDLIEEESCTWTMVVPTMVQMLASVPGAKDRDLSSLRVVNYGAAPISEKGLLAGIELWGNIMHQSYGQSEALPAAILPASYHSTSGTERARRILSSAGRPTPNTVITIRDDHGELLPQGETGEICVKSPGGMKGIWGDPEATAARLTPDGAIKTRDMGYLDEEGFLHLVDRKEDLIISGGFNVWPLEVEYALSSHPAVEEVAVVGVPDDKWGEAVFAVVTLAEGATATSEELIEFAREKVGSVKRPKSLVIATEPLPKSAVGKLLRRQVREQYWTPADD